MTRVGAIGPGTLDTVELPDGSVHRRPGGAPLYAARALRFAGAEAVVIENRGRVLSHIVHDPGGTRQEIRAAAEPFDEADVHDRLLPALVGCSWVLLGGQIGNEFPPPVIEALGRAGLSLCLDAQGLVRGDRLGPLRLRPFGLEVVRGIRALKLNEAEARAALGGDGPQAARSAGTPEVLITCGARGALVVTATAAETVVGSGVPFTDPTGAGDSLAALYCLGRTRGAAPVEAARFAVAQVELLYAEAAS